MTAVPIEGAQLLEGWVGDASLAAVAYVECRRSFWESFADFLLWPAENLLQIVDYVLDAVRWAVTWISWLAGALTMLIFVVDVIALVVTGGAGSIAAILSAPVFVVLGAITLVGGVVALLLYFINMGIEWLQTITRG